MDCCPRTRPQVHLLRTLAVLGPSVTQEAPELVMVTVASAKPSACAQGFSKVGFASEKTLDWHGPYGDKDDGQCRAVLP